MSDASKLPGSWLEQRLAALEALYQKYGRDGLQDQPLADIRLLLSEKEMKFRDAPRRDLTETQKCDNRRAELEIRDISSYLNALAAAAGLHPSHSPRLSRSETQPHKPNLNNTKQKDYDRER